MASLGALTHFFRRCLFLLEWNANLSLLARAVIRVQPLMSTNPSLCIGCTQSWSHTMLDDPTPTPTLRRPHTHTHPWTTHPPTHPTPTLGRPHTPHPPLDDPTPHTHPWATPHPPLDDPPHTPHTHPWTTPHTHPWTTPPLHPPLDDPPPTHTPLDDPPPHPPLDDPPHTHTHPWTTPLHTHPWTTPHTHTPLDDPPPTPTLGRPPPHTHTPHTPLDDPTPTPTLGRPHTHPWTTPPHTHSIPMYRDHIVYWGRQTRVSDWNVWCAMERTGNNVRNMQISHGVLLGDGCHGNTTTSAGTTQTYTHKFLWRTKNVDNW